jgi:glycine/serine hydroxymethyltransferase
MKEIARIFTEALKNHENESELDRLNWEVKKMCELFPIYR